MFVRLDVRVSVCERANGIEARAEATAAERFEAEKVCVLFVR